MGMGTKLAKGTLVAITKYRSVDGGVVHALRQIVRVLVGVVCLVWVPSSVWGGVVERTESMVMKILFVARFGLVCAKELLHLIFCLSLIVANRASDLLDRFLLRYRNDPLAHRRRCCCCCGWCCCCWCCGWWCWYRRGGSCVGCESFCVVLTQCVVVLPPCLYGFSKLKFSWKFPNKFFVHACNGQNLMHMGEQDSPRTLQPHLSVASYWDHNNHSFCERSATVVYDTTPFSSAARLSEFFRGVNVIRARACEWIAKFWVVLMQTGHDIDNTSIIPSIWLVAARGLLSQISYNRSKPIIRRLLASESHCCNVWFQQRSASWARAGHSLQDFVSQFISLARIFCQYLDCPIQYHDGKPDTKRDVLSSEPEKFESTMMDETEINDADQRSSRTN